MEDQSGPNYWLDLFTWQTWQEFLRGGASVSGWRQPRRGYVLAMRPGDVLLCYLTGVSRFVGALEVTSRAYEDDAPVWTEETFPVRVKVKPVMTLTAEAAVPVHDLLPLFSWSDGSPSPPGWSGYFRGSPAKWSRGDGEMVLAALRSAAAHPVERPIERHKLHRRAKMWSGRHPPVTIPPEKPQEPDSDVGQSLAGEQPAGYLPTSADEQGPVDAGAHTEIQHLLLKLGSDMGLGVWVARNDRNREYKGQRLADIATVREELPRQFDEDTSRTIRLIDVLWLRRDTVVGAFEIEKSTSIYSGLLRMADLVALQPNLNIPLYIVAPDARRAKVREEINRPVFSRALEPPLAATCRYIAFDRLREEVARVGNLVRHLKPEFMAEISEDCSLP